MITRTVHTVLILIVVLQLSTLPAQTKMEQLKEKDKKELLNKIGDLA